MPKTKLQEAIFGIMTVLIMVYGMSVYNVLMRNGGSLHSFFEVSIKEMSILAVIAFSIQALIAIPLTKKLISKIIEPEKTNVIVASLSFPVIMVCLMCLTMSLTAIILYTGINTQTVFKWFHAILINFPVALFLQIVIAGPVVRFIFRNFFANESIEIREY